MTKDNIGHPKEDCPNCGITHLSYSLHQLWRPRYCAVCKKTFNFKKKIMYFHCGRELELIGESK